MSLTERFDGSYYPDREADNALLSETTCPTAETKLGYAYHRTIGDLVIELLIGRPLTECGDSSPQNWETLEHAMLVNASLELRAINAAMSESTSDDHADDVTAEECSTMLRVLSRRLEAGAELSHRLRAARWGHPAFGGGEGWEAKVNAERAESAKKSEASL